MGVGRTMKNLVRRRFLTLLTLFAVVIVPTAAIASEHESGDGGDEEVVEDVDQEPELDTAERFDAIVDAQYDELLHLLFFAINVADAGEPVDCTTPEDVVLERSEDDDSGDVGVTVIEGEWEIPEGCNVVDVEGPNGQVNHGQVVSSMVHALKALDLSGLDVPFGQLVRQIAGSDLGKGDQQVKANEGDDLDGDEDGDDKKGPPPHANNDKDKKPKGNGNGPNK